MIYLNNHCFYPNSAAMGGLLGLGLGLSFISVFEIIYFFILRWVFPSTKSSKSEETDGQSTPLLKKNEQ